MILEDLKPNASIRGIVPDSLVTVVSVQWFGSEALELTYKTATGKIANELLYRHDEARLEAVERGPEETAIQLMEADQYLLDVSALRLLPALAAVLGSDGPKILVSRSLHDMLTMSDVPRRTALLMRLIGARGHNKEAQCKAIAEAYSYMQDQERIVVLDNPESRLALGASRDVPVLEGVPMATDKAYDPEAEWVVGTNADTIVEHSAVTGTPILMKNRSLARSLRGRVTVIEIADQVESLIERKQALTTRLFGARHTRSVKFFVGAVIAIGGIWAPPLGVAGVVFALVDP